MFLTKTISHYSLRSAILSNLKILQIEMWFHTVLGLGYQHINRVRTDFSVKPHFAAGMTIFKFEWSLTKYTEFKAPKNLKWE